MEVRGPRHADLIDLTETAGWCGSKTQASATGGNTHTDDMWVKGLRIVLGTDIGWMELDHHMIRQLDNMPMAAVGTRSASRLRLQSEQQ